MENKRGRGYTRAQKQRAQARAQRCVSQWYRPLGDMIEDAHRDRMIQQYTVARTPCSCWICSGHDQGHRQEHAAALGEREQRQEAGA